MTKKKCPLGEACDLTIAWMAGRQHAIDRYREEANPIIEAKDAEIERLRGDLKKAEWLLVDASVQLAEGRIKTRRNRALLIRQFLAALTGAKP